MAARTTQPLRNKEISTQRRRLRVGFVAARRPTPDEGKSGNTRSRSRLDLVFPLFLSSGAPSAQSRRQARRDPLTRARRERENCRLRIADFRLQIADRRSRRVRPSCLVRFEFCALVVSVFFVDLRVLRGSSCFFVVRPPQNFFATSFMAARAAAIVVSTSRLV